MPQPHSEDCRGTNAHPFDAAAWRRAFVSATASENEATECKRGARGEERATRFGCEDTGDEWVVSEEAKGLYGP